MLRKLLKHEFKATSRLLVPLYMALLCISIINHFTFNYGIKEGILAVITGALFTIQALFTMAIVTAATVFMVVRFYKNFLSDEGYLMFTLPVSTHQLILSKLMITLFWVVVSAIGAAISWFITVGPINDISLVGFFTETVGTLFTQLNSTFGLRWVMVFIELVILGLLILVGNILMVYTSIAIGQLFKKYKIIASFVSYVVITTILQILGAVGMIGLGSMFPNNLTSLEMVPNVLLPTAIIIALIGCSVFYIATNYIFSRKLNLE